MISPEDPLQTLVTSCTSADKIRVGRGRTVRLNRRDVAQQKWGFTLDFTNTKMGVTRLTLC